MSVDPEAAARAYRERVVGPYRGVLPKDAVRHMEEQLSGSCTVEIAAFDEFTGLFTNNAIAGEFDNIVFDTAPTGHTLRLLGFPAAWSDFLNTNTNGSSCLGPLSGLNAQKDRYEATVAALADAKQTTFVMVARAEPSALAEADRSGGELAALGLKNQHLVVDGTSDAELRRWLIERDPDVAALFAKLDVGWKLPRSGEFTVYPSNASAEARIVRHLLRERLEQCGR